MRAYEIRGQGVDSLTPTELEAGPMGPEDVRIATEAVSVNFRDYALAEGLYLPELRRPYIPLSDGAGRVLEVGSEVRGLKPGDRVVGQYTTRWFDGPFKSANNATKLGGPLDGWLCTQKVLPASAALKVPDYLSIEEAATLPVSGLTAWTALGEPQSLDGQRVLIQGTGSVSLAALQIGYAAGARVIVLTRKPALFDTLCELGAGHVVDATAADDTVDEIRAWTCGQGIDIAVEVLGGDQLPRTLSMMADNGRISIVGFLRGYEFNGNLVGPMIARQIKIQGISVGSCTQFERYLAFLEAHAIHPIIGSRYHFEAAADAIRDRGDTATLGKPIVTMARP